jgi:putative ABC transport system substrate-binding protein
MKEIEPVAQALGIKIQSLIVVRPHHLERAFSAILHADRAQPRESPRGLLVPTTVLIIANKARIFEFAAERKLPAIYDRRPLVDAGGLMYYGTDLVELRRLTANYVDKILKGAKPGDLPIERLTKFNFVINLKTAKQLGVTIPPEVLYRATKVIK